MTSEQLSIKGCLPLFLLSLCFITRAAASSGDGSLGVPNRAPGAVVEFDFLREDCLNGLFLSSNSSSSVNEITRQESGACLPYNGFTATTDLAPSAAAVSASPLTGLLDVLGTSTTMTFGLWILPPPQLPTEEASTGSLLSFEYNNSDIEFGCDFSLELFEMGKVESRQSGATFCHNGDLITLEKGAVYADLSDPSSMHYLVVTFEFYERTISGPGGDTTTHYAYTTSSSDARPESLSTQTAADVGSFHPSTFNSLSLPFLSLLTPRGSPSSSWTGQLLQLSLYSRLLTDQEVYQNYRAGLHNSLPLSWNLTVHGLEDTLTNLTLPVMDADNQAWHANSQLNNCTNRSYDLSGGGGEVGGVCSKMFVRLVRAPSRGQLFVTLGDSPDLVPLAVGDSILYTPSSEPDIAGPTQTGNGNYKVHYRPLQHQHSISDITVYDSFSFVAVDGWTGEESVDEGNVSLIIAPVNDPPVAFNNSAVVHSRQCVVLPALEGTDAADWFGNGQTSTAGGTSIHHSVDKAVIFSLPPNGTLHQVNPDLSLVSEAMTLPPPSGTVLLQPFTVGYCYTGDETVLRYELPNAGVVIGTDEFTFGVVGSTNDLSAPASMTVEVLTQLRSESYDPIISGSGQDLSSPLAASAAQLAMPLESEISEVMLFGEIISNVALEQNLNVLEVLTIQIDQVPCNGSLFDVTSGAPLVKGHVVPTRMQPLTTSPGHYFVKVGYKAQRGFFTYPQVAWDGSSLRNGTMPLDSFLFSVVAFDTVRQEVVAVSPPVKQQIAVRNNNDPTEIEFSFPKAKEAEQGYYEVLPYSGTTSEEWSSPPTLRGSLLASARVNSNMVTATSTGGGLLNISSDPFIIMNGAFHITDWDLDTDLIVAHVASVTGKGFISLNPEHLSGVDFTSTKYCFSPSSRSWWECEGSGYNDPSMVFVGTPANISRALNGLRYLSTSESHTDWVNITLRDGSGARLGLECLEEHLLLRGGNADLTTNRQGCFASSVAIEVHVLSFPPARKDYNPFDVFNGLFTDRNIALGALGLSVAIIVVFYCGSNIFIQWDIRRERLLRKAQRAKAKEDHAEMERKRKSDPGYKKKLQAARVKQRREKEVAMIRRLEKDVVYHKNDLYDPNNIAKTANNPASVSSGEEKRVSSNVNGSAKSDNTINDVQDCARPRHLNQHNNTRRPDRGILYTKSNNRKSHRDTRTGRAMDEEHKSDCYDENCS